MTHLTAARPRRLTIYGYWNEGGQDNIVSMLVYICNTFFADTGAKPAEVVSTPQTGCLHQQHVGFFDSPAAYLQWYAAAGPVQDKAAPVVAVLLYRKHVITKQDYIGQLIGEMEGAGLRPVPIFINGVEAHTVVRDLLTSRDEAAALAGGAARPQGLRKDAIVVRADSCVAARLRPLVGGAAILNAQVANVRLCVLLAAGCSDAYDMLCVMAVPLAQACT